MSVFSVRDAAHFLGIDITDFEYEQSIPSAVLNREKIWSAVSDEFGESKKKILSRDRTQYLADARAVGWWLHRSLFGTSYPQMGKMYHRDHSTIMHAIKRIDECIFYKDYKRLGKIALSIRRRLS